ncbi:DNA-directed RNA polymerase subunit alpha [Acidobacteria bacterium AH-259-L09]|nr:DNA-directed RNA polymerase subunit alpha [Acidobacteria bacterium AH-259-L09]
MGVFQRPKTLFADQETLSPNFGHFYAQPFERGFGNTIGNALRRALLSSIEGAAITAVKIEGILHEFSSIPGVQEDVTDLVMNLKKIPIRLHVDRPKTLYLESRGEGDLKARHIKPDPAVEILDEDVHIATVSDTANLNIEMRVKKGRGYVPADKNFEEDLDIGYIPLDSVHSPVKKVNFYVEAARLGQLTDYDELNLEVWTNGCISPEDAVAQAAKILKDHLYIFINFEEEAEMLEAEEEQELVAMNQSLTKSVEELELSVRSYNCLKNADIQSIGDLVTKTEAEMLKTKNFGRKSLNEIKEILADMGLSFGMNLEEGRPVQEEVEA